MFRFDLCSDTGGATPVDQLTLPALVAGVWNAVTINKGSNLGSSIGSIRLFAISDPGVVTLVIDDIIACKSATANDCLTLNSLISSDNATWYAIKSINGTAIRLDTSGSESAQSATGIWAGTTGSLALSILQPLFKTVSSTPAPITDTFNNATSGTAGSPITISGGWNTTDMTTQTGLTVLDGGSENATPGLTIGCDYVTLDRFVFTRFDEPIKFNGSTKKGYALSNATITNCDGSFSMPSHAMTFNGFKLLNSVDGVSVPQTTNYGTDNASYNLGAVTVVGASGVGITIPSNIGSPQPIVHDCAVYGGGSNTGFSIQSLCVFYNNTANDNSSGSTGIGFLFQNVRGLKAYNLQARNNSGADIQLNDASVEIYTLDTNFNLGTQIKCVAGTENEATIYNWTPNGTATKYSLGDSLSSNCIASQKEGGTAGNNNFYTNFGTVTTNSVTPQSGAGKAWKLSPNANALSTSPLSLNVGRIACPANQPTQIKYWAKLSAAGPSAQLRIPGGRYAGVGSAGTDVTTAVSATTYTEYSITVTPTEDAVVDVFFDVWGSSTQNATISGPVTVNQ